MNLKQSPRYGLYIFLFGVIPLIGIALYPAYLRFLGRAREAHILLHSQGYHTLLFCTVLLPFAVFIILRVTERIKTGRDAVATIVSVTTSGAKMRQGVDEYWGADLMLDVAVPGEEPFRMSMEHYIHVLGIPRFQPGNVLDIKIMSKGKKKYIAFTHEKE
ncbi:MAG: hypothetical protein A2W19_00785 [Spirochaetes bacterium RBG_16_49_21]|nr:MAG: hypothetical protein A2W19_00785 [Spirochaetes bacterium RBG_16_49_21]